MPNRQPEKLVNRIPPRGPRGSAQNRQRQRSSRSAPRLTAQEQEREAARKALKRAVAREREIQALSKRYQRELQKSNDEVQHLAILLAARARALDVTDEQQRAING